MKQQWRVKTCQRQRRPNRAIIQHPLTDLKHISPLFFSFLLKECCDRGSTVSTIKAIQEYVNEAFLTSRHPRLATFVARCLYIFPIFPQFSSSSEMILSAFLPLINQVSSQDILSARSLSARLFMLSVWGKIYFNETKMLKIVQTFGVKTEDTEKAMISLKAENSDIFASETSKNFVEEYIWRIVKSNEYELAEDFLEHFSMENCEEKFLLRMIESNRIGTAENWACFVGDRLIGVLVREYSRLNMLKLACRVVAERDLRAEFPEIFIEYRKSVIKKFAKKCLWEIAEQRTKGDPKLIEYLVLTTIELGFYDKANELCTRYSLNHLRTFKGSETANKTLKLGSLNVNEVIFVDKSYLLCEATSRILQCGATGVDCEWKANRFKGQANKVSILQLSAESVVFIVDLIKLVNENRQLVDGCLSTIFKSTSVLKIGYDFKCDMKQLRESYSLLECFKDYKLLLDLPDLCREQHGGLSGLSEKILGKKLDKTVRMSDWERRPLSKSQLEYAALDVAALVHIFYRVRDGMKADVIKENWRSYLSSDLLGYV